MFVCQVLDLGRIRIRVNKTLEPDQIFFNMVNPTPIYQLHSCCFCCENPLLLRYCVQEGLVTVNNQVVAPDYKIGKRCVAKQNTKKNWRKKLQSQKIVWNYFALANIQQHYYYFSTTGICSLQKTTTTCHTKCTGTSCRSQPSQFR